MSSSPTRDLKSDGAAIAAVVLFVALVVWWGVLAVLQETEQVLELKGIWGAAYQIVALWGGIWGILIANSWGGTRSIMGRSILAFAIGLLLQNLGQSVFSYYNLVLNIELPYPSIADIGYFGSIPFYAYGVLMLAKASGVGISLKSYTNKLQALTIPLILLGLSYYFFLTGYDMTEIPPLQIFLDFGYPLGQAIYVSLAILTYLLSAKTLGGVMKNKVLLILAALVIQYVADYNFLYQAYYGSWSVSGYGDVLYLGAYFLMAIGLIQLKEEFIKTRSSK